MFVTSFSDFHQSLDEYPKGLKGVKLHKWILSNLRKRERVSCFEIQEDWRMCRTFMFLVRGGKIKLSNEGHHYPYSGVFVR